MYYIPENETASFYPCDCIQTVVAYADNSAMDIYHIHGHHNNICLTKSRNN